MAENKNYVGGSFAPALDDKKLAEYRKLADKASPAVGEAMKSLIKMMETFHSRPKAKDAAKATNSRPHPSGMGMITGLPDEEVKRIWDVVPWQHEVDMYKQLFESIPADSEKAIRDAAFHLVWVAQELTIDREPLTADNL
jgi:hypothetical protein